ncbi:PTS sugar transporter subunit IIA [bacterium]|jgi:nitrogen PTS system EIIA component|nr:PTS sugar transporter subunit IIA [bacterium]MBT3850568.1 PTS sugar transporter subunit IIA [bacterium]MBT4434808.1 PTS sugar transporter subunit IIA [bacterium]MDG2446164.1 PTS sugar transporter subunit IIA [Thermodesulfobacteriota bacterium]|tara:strand:+ start:499 stop:951 length:453 start_codon:yes stop_codon:yes gene_type:complete
MKLSNLLTSKMIFNNLKSTKKEDFIKSLIDKVCLVDTSLKKPILNELISKREELCSTALDNHIAVPHARIPGLDKSSAWIGVCSDGVDFGSIDELKTKVFILILQNDQDGNHHLEILKSIAKLFSKKIIVDKIANQENPQKILEIIKENE